MNILQPIKNFFGFPQANAPPACAGTFPAEVATNNDVFPARANNAELSAQLKGNEMGMLNLLKAIFELVKTIEAALPDSPGKEKFDAVMGILDAQAGAAVAQLPIVASFINSAVSILNIIGVFRKKTAA